MLNLIHLFEETHKYITYSNDSLEVSRIEDEDKSDFKYIYSKPVDIDDICESEKKDYSFYFDCDGEGIICGGVVFLNQNKEKIGSLVKNCNQIFDFELPEEARFIGICLRTIKEYKFKINYFMVGEKSKIHAETNRLSSFQNQAITENISKHQNRKIIVETIFCDTETRHHALEKYFSFFSTQIYLMSRQTERNFVWVIHISSDKQFYIDKIAALLSAYNLHKQCFINVFSHPKNGYNNENETHIDRRCRPNASYPERRDYLFNLFIDKFKCIDLSEGNIIARVSTDDDDFMLPNYIAAINLLISKYRGDIELNEYVCLGFGRNYVATYKTNGSVFMEDVSLSRLIPGMKFVCSNKKIPRSPFGLPEDFNAEKGNNRKTYIDDHSLPPCYIYNRHGANYSNGQKNLYYIQKFNELLFDNHKDLIDYILT
ncbi:hypothetical protein QOY93_05305 [Leclercia adecarboxylata]|uniref:hypothetical protein n=1 Tax=Leclercia adecarboxylata TaxID=83655 RepID=UPI00255063C5|nr:hypothetical protein [Leclercia adecarboxylata]MDK4744789.1 hypothetical protein [Leclercia adecarboxylata]